MTLSITLNLFVKHSPKQATFQYNMKTRFHVDYRYQIPHNRLTRNLKANIAPYSKYLYTADP